MIVFGNHGELTVNPETGDVLSYRHEGFDSDSYKDILRFDVREWQKHYGKPLNGSVDILDIGYWTATGYEPADPNHRQIVAEGNTGIVASANAGRVLGFMP